MSFFRSIFRHVSPVNSFQVTHYGPNNSAFSTFVPSSISGLTTWIDLGDATAITSSGGYIDAITNKGSVSCTFRPTTSDTRPYLSASSINSRDSAGFDGIDDILTSSVAAATVFGYVVPPPSNQMTNFTTFMAFKPNRIDTSAIFAYNLDVLFAEGNGSLGMNIGTSFSNSERVWFDNGSSDVIKYLRSNSGQITVGTVASVAVRFMTMSYDLYINGTFVSGVIKTNNPTADGNSLRIGNEIFPSVGGPAKIDLAEFLFYSGTLSPTEITQVSSYLSNRWGIV